MRKRNVVRLTESQLNRVIKEATIRCIKEGALDGIGQGARMAWDGIRGAVTGKDPRGNDIYPQPSNIGDDFEREMDAKVADSNLDMPYYDEFGGPSFNPADESRPADMGAWGRGGRKVGMAIGDGARRLGGKVRDVFGGNGTNGPEFTIGNQGNFDDDFNADFAAQEEGPEYDDEEMMESRRRYGRRMNEGYGRRSYGYGRRMNEGMNRRSNGRRPMRRY